MLKKNRFYKTGNLPEKQSALVSTYCKANMQHIYMYTVKNTEHNEIKVGDSSLLLHENCVHVHTSEEHHRNCNSAVSKVVFWTGDENMFGCTALTPTRTPHPPLTVDLVDLRVL